MKISKFLKITEKELKNDYKIDKKFIPIITSCIFKIILNRVIFKIKMFYKMTFLLY